MNLNAELNKTSDLQFNYKILRKHIDIQSPRKFNNFSIMNTFRGAMLDKHNFSNLRSFIEEFAFRTDKSMVMELASKLDRNELSDNQFMDKLIDIINSKYLILPLISIIKDKESTPLHQISHFENNENKWSNDYTGFVCVSYKRIVSEYGVCDKETILVVKNRLKEELRQYQEWLLDEVYDYKLIKVDENNNILEELESYGILYGTDFEENGLYKLVPEEYKYLLCNKDRFLIKIDKYKPLNNSILEITKFIEKEIPFDRMIKNLGIYETGVLARLDDGDEITIGVCYEDNIDYEECVSEEFTKEHYYYNLFAGGEYIDLSNSYAYKDNLIPEVTIKEILEEIFSLNSSGITWVYEDSTL